MKNLIISSIVAIIPVVASFCFAGKSPSQAEFKTDQIQVLVDIQSNIYKYKVINQGTSHIVGFEIPQHAAYNFIAPEGWQKESPEGIFRTWTDESLSAIGPGRSAEFSLRVSSKGAVLGNAPAKIRLQSGETIIIPQVWAPIPEPKSYIALIAGLILAIVLLHTVILTHRGPRKAKTSVNDA